MSERYTREDVIMWADDPRAKEAIGKECFCADTVKTVLDYANDYDDDDNCYTLTSIEEGRDYPFKMERIEFACIIVKKEQEKELVPFDFSLEEDRAKLRGKYLKCTTASDYCESLCMGFCGDWADIGDSLYLPSDILENYTFLDGSPCGKEIEE